MVGANGAAKPLRNEDSVACKDWHALPRCAGLSKKQSKDARIFASERRSNEQDGLAAAYAHWVLRLALTRKVF
jgi:hypothetical protein